MTVSSDFRGADDPHDLARFVRAQEGDYEAALSEIRGGRKRTHWMWYVFPQLDGLAFSPTSKYYAIKGLDEARAYLGHPVLGSRLRECAEAALGVGGRSAAEVFGSPDDLKLRSCATLFACVSPPGSALLRTKMMGGPTRTLAVACRLPYCAVMVALPRPFPLTTPKGSMLLTVAVFGALDWKNVSLVTSRLLPSE